MRSAALLLVTFALHATTARADDGPPGAQLPAAASYVPPAAAMRAWPEELDADDGKTPPLGYTAVERTRKGLIIGGALTLGTGYAYAALIAAQGENGAATTNNARASLWIPIVGPFIELDRANTGVEKEILVAIGGAQVVGALLLYYGLTTTTRVFVRSDLAGGLTVAPMAANGAQGLSLAGHF